MDIRLFLFLPVFLAARATSASPTAYVDAPTATNSGSTAPATSAPAAWRFSPMSRQELKIAVDLWHSNQIAALSTYGHISGWDTSAVTDMNSLFVSMTGLSEDLASWDTSSVTNMSCMFQGASSFNGDLSSWTTSRVIDMSCMFQGASSFNSDLSSWDTSSVSDMNSMFYSAEIFNGDVSAWDTSGVTDMSNMFSYAYAFSGDIAGWDTSSVTDMSHMFQNAVAFHCDLSSWNTANVTNMRYMFADADAFNGDLSKWDTSHVIDMSGMFYGADIFNSDLSSWNTASVTDMSNMFRGPSAFNGSIARWNTASVTDMSSMFFNAYIFNSDLSRWDTSKVTDMERMFSYACDFTGADISSWDTSSVVRMGSMFLNAYAFNGDISGWDTSSVRDMSSMFAKASSFNRDLSSWDTSKVTNMQSMFLAARSFNGNISTWDTSSVTDMSFMFYAATIFNGDISRWGTSGVRDMTEMFRSASAFNCDLSSWDTSSVTSMSRMFSGATSLHSDLSGWDTSRVTTMRSMFSRAYRFDSNLSSWNTSRVTTMRNAFFSARSFNGDVSGWDTSSVTGMSNMFYDARAFNADISGWNTSRVTDMQSMFSFAGTFNHDLSRWNTSGVTDMADMFYAASSFNGDLSGWDTSSVTDMSFMFYAASSFNRDLSSWDTSKVVDMTEMFLDAQSFSQDVSGWNTSSIASDSGLDAVFCCDAPGFLNASFSAWPYRPSCAGNCYDPGAASSRTWATSRGQTAMAAQGSREASGTQANPKLNVTILPGASDAEDAFRCSRLQSSFVTVATLHPWAPKVSAASLLIFIASLLGLLVAAGAVDMWRARQEHAWSDANFFIFQHDSPGGDLGAQAWNDGKDVDCCPDAPLYFPFTMLPEALRDTVAEVIKILTTDVAAEILASTASHVDTLRQICFGLWVLVSQLIKCFVSEQIIVQVNSLEIVLPKPPGVIESLVAATARVAIDHVVHRNACASNLVHFDDKYHDRTDLWGASAAPPSAAAEMAGIADMRRTSSKPWRLSCFKLDKVGEVSTASGLPSKSGSSPQSPSQPSPGRFTNIFTQPSLAKDGMDTDLEASPPTSPTFQRWSSSPPASPHSRRAQRARYQTIANILRKPAPADGGTEIDLEASPTTSPISRRSSSSPPASPSPQKARRERVFSSIFSQKAPAKDDMEIDLEASPPPSPRRGRESASSMSPHSRRAQRGRCRGIPNIFPQPVPAEDGTEIDLEASPPPSPRSRGQGSTTSSSSQQSGRVQRARHKVFTNIFTQAVPTEDATEIDLEASPPPSPRRGRGSASSLSPPSRQAQRARLPSFEPQALMTRLVESVVSPATTPRDGQNDGARPHRFEPPPLAPERHVELAPSIPPTTASASAHLEKLRSSHSQRLDQEWASIHGCSNHKLRGLILQLLVHSPLGSIYVFSMSAPSTLRALAFICDIVGALAMVTFFLSVSGSFRSLKNLPECSRGEDEHAAHVRVLLALGALSALLAKLPVSLIFKLHLRDFLVVAYRGCKAHKVKLRAWRILDLLVWILCCSYAGFCIIYITSILANAAAVDRQLWMASAGMAMLTDLVLVPLVSILLPPLVVVLCIWLLAAWTGRSREDVVGQLQAKGDSMANAAAAACQEARDARGEDGTSVAPPRSFVQLPSAASSMHHLQSLDHGRPDRYLGSPGNSPRSPAPCQDPDSPTWNRTASCRTVRFRLRTALPW